jgi:Domain of unknown function (DUF4382)
MYGNTITKMRQAIDIFLALLGATMGATILVACSGGDSGGVDNINPAGGGRGGIQNGFLSLSITDAPIDGAVEVWVQFDSVILKSASDPDTITLSFDPPMSINLLALQGQNSAPLFANKTLPAGNYEWLKLKVTATKDGILDSYIKLRDNTVYELNIPSGSESGLKIIGGLEVIANTPTRLTIDFDLRKSIILKGTGGYALKPVLKLVNNANSGSISGTVPLPALTDPGCSDSDPVTGNAIYLYNNFNVTPDDIDNIGVEPVASALLALNNSTGAYEYSFGFIPLGKYTAAFTCQADLDNPASDDNIVFSKTRNVNLTNAVITKTLPSNTFR